MVTFANGLGTDKPDPMHVPPASATFSKEDEPANIRNQARMIELAGSADRIVPGHDMLQFQKFPTEGRIAKIK